MYHLITKHYFRDENLADSGVPSSSAMISMATRCLQASYKLISLPAYRQRCLCNAASNIREDELIKSLRNGIAPATGRPLSEVAAEVWGHSRNVAGPSHRSGQKLLRKPLKGPLYTSWYPEPMSAIPENPFKLTPKQQRWKEKLKILRASGKGPPKKGAGKRSK